MRTKTSKHDALLKHPPLTSIFEQNSLNLISEKIGDDTVTNVITTTTPSDNPNYQVSVIVPQIVEKAEVVANNIGGHDEQPANCQQTQSLLTAELRRVSVNNENCSISLPVVLTNGSTEIEAEHCQSKANTICSADIRRGSNIDCQKGGHGKVEFFSLRRSSRP